MVRGMVAETRRSTIEHQRYERLLEQQRLARDALTPEEVGHWAECMNEAPDVVEALAGWSMPDLEFAGRVSAVLEFAGVAISGTGVRMRRARRDMAANGRETIS